MKKFMFMALALLFCFLMLFASIPIPVMAQTTGLTVNVPAIWGSNSTATYIVEYDYILDEDVDTYLKITDWDTMWYIEGNRYLDNQAIDNTETTYGKHSTDWLGVANDADYPANAGVGKWVMNGTSDASNGDYGSTGTSVETDSTVDPSNGGFKKTTTVTASATDTDGVSEVFLANYMLDGDVEGVDNVVTSNSYMLISAALAYDKDDEVPNGLNRESVGIAIWFSDGASYFPICFYISNTTVAYWFTEELAPTDDTWEDLAAKDSTYLSAANLGFTSTVGGRAFCVEASATKNTNYEFCYAFNIQDLIDASSGTTITASECAGYSVYYSETYVNSTTTDWGKAIIRNCMIVDSYEDLSLYEETESTDSSTDISNNFINGTTMTLDQTDRYPLEAGFQFQIPIQRLAFTSYDLSYEYDIRADPVADPLALSYRLDYTFDTSLDEEDLTAPTTLYLNISSLSANYQMSQITCSGENGVASDGNLISGWTIVDSDSSPSINDITDIYSDFSDMDSPLMITPETAISTSNEYTVRITSSAPSGDSVYGTIGAGIGSLGAGLGVLLAANIFGFSLVGTVLLVTIVVPILFAGVAFGFNVTAAERKGGSAKRKAEKQMVMIGILVAFIIDVVLIVLSYTM